jgi:hypothetical protein
MEFSDVELRMKLAPQINCSRLTEISRSSGIYTAWLSGNPHCLYVGKAGNLFNRIKSHYSGHRGGDQFCLYIYDHYIYPDRPLGLDTLAVDRITGAWIKQNVSFRYVEVPLDEMRVHEDRLRREWKPVLNPINKEI